MNAIDSKRAIRSATFLPYLSESKIAALHLDRKLVENLRFSGMDSPVIDSFYSHLWQLQRAIYVLDYYGETTWAVDANVIKTIWAEIYASLHQFGVGKQDADFLCADLKRYQQIELGLRVGEMPTRIPLPSYYRLKTCDVRLSRQLISKIIGKKNAEVDAVLAPLWSTYDLASEVCDDLSDVVEDLGTYNCNRFMLECGSSGTFATIEAYSSFLCQLGRATLTTVSNLTTSVPDESSALAQWIVERLEEAAWRLRGFSAIFASKV